MSEQRTEVVVIGAGPAGLAVGACLRREGIPFTILERADRVGAVWHRHYQRLHLHTDKAHSRLPFTAWPRGCPTYPSRNQVIDYLESYARRHELEPRFGQNVVAARRDDGGWRTETEDGSYHSSHLVVATSYTGQPVVPAWPGRETYRGTVIHSSAYRSGAPYRDQSVLVVGFGNSGGEIAIDLWEQGARPCLAVRGPVNVVPRDLFGLPILAISIPMRKLPPRIADAFTAPVVRWKCGDIRRLGLQRASDGPLAQIYGRSRIPLLDVGTLELIRQGHVQVRPGLECFTEKGVVFTDGSQLDCDAVVLATGYKPAVRAFLGDSPALDDEGVPSSSGAESEVPGLYFCGFFVAPTGMFREIAIEARRIARAIATKRNRYSIERERSRR
jgi:cation diffusion facilitator CzcD-associated flavoprotein CzcO